MASAYDEVDPVSVRPSKKFKYRDVAPGANIRTREYMQSELMKIQGAYSLANSLATLRYGYQLARMGCSNLPDELCDLQVVDTERIAIDNVVDSHLAKHMLKQPSGRVPSVFSRV